MQWNLREHGQYSTYLNTSHSNFYTINSPLKNDKYQITSCEIAWSCIETNQLAPTMSCANEAARWIRTFFSRSVIDSARWAKNFPPKRGSVRRDGIATWALCGGLPYGLVFVGCRATHICLCRWLIQLKKISPTCSSIGIIIYYNPLYIYGMDWDGIYFLPIETNNQIYISTCQCVNSSGLLSQAYHYWVNWI